MYGGLVGPCSVQERQQRKQRADAAALHFFCDTGKEVERKGKQKEGRKGEKKVHQYESGVDKQRKIEAA
jgi:hypothetical protein